MSGALITDAQGQPLPDRYQRDGAVWTAVYDSLVNAVTVREAESETAEVVRALYAAAGSLGLTADEQRVVELLAEAHNVFITRVTVDGETRAADEREWVSHIHVLQHMVMAQAAARAHPDRYRLLGGVVGD